MKKVIKFEACWCAPCKAFKPTFEKVSTNPEFKDIAFEVLDVDDNEAIAEKYNIRSIPCTVFIDENGNESGRLVGLQTEENLTNAVRMFCK